MPPRAITPAWKGLSCSLSTLPNQFYTNLIKKDTVFFYNKLMLFLQQGISLGFSTKCYHKPCFSYHLQGLWTCFNSCNLLSLFNFMFPFPVSAGSFVTVYFIENPNCRQIMFACYLFAYTHARTHPPTHACEHSAHVHTRTHNTHTHPLHTHNTHTAHVHTEHTHARTLPPPHTQSWATITLHIHCLMCFPQHSSLRLF